MSLLRGRNDPGRHPEPGRRILVPEGRPALSWLNKDAITLADSGSSVFGGAAAEAFNCPRCKKIILDYSVRHLPL